MMPKQPPLIRGPSGLQVLAGALRKPMPYRFTFNFRNVHEPEGCGSVGCAMGLADKLWPGHQLATITGMAEFFDISYADGISLFAPRMRRVNYDKVTPAVMAEAIETYLRTGEVWPLELCPQ